MVSRGSGLLSLVSFLVAAVVILTPSLHTAFAATDQNDVAALTNLYTSLNYPGQLTAWTSNGNADPCGQSWKGVQCSGSSVTQLTLSGLNLNGQLGYQMDKLKSLTVLDLSDNQINGNLPYQLPPNLTTFNIGNNNLGGSFQYSIASMNGLTYLNMSHNHFSGSLPDAFSKFTSLATMDLSFNTIGGSLPQTFSSLYSLSSLYVQNNQFSGSLNVLANLQLENLDVENNQFTGWVPASFSKIPNVHYDGNRFSTSPAPPPPPFTPPPPVPKAKSSGKKSGSDSKSTGSSSSLSTGAIAGVVVACLLGLAVVGLIVAFFLWKPKEKYITDEEKQQSSAPALGPLAPLVTKVAEPAELSPTLVASETALKPPPLVDTFKAPPPEKPAGRKLNNKRGQGKITASSYSVASLQQATNSFSQENLIGEGALGRVFRAELPNGKVLAVKKMDTSAIPALQSEDEFMEIVSNVSRLRHANITELVGYCTEHGQRLLIYEYFGKGSLSDTLHGADTSAKMDLTWNVRVKIALGAAQALEYLHEVSQPAVVHKNLSSNNILLDDELNPHLSDCTICASNPEQQSSASGYNAPEYALSGTYTWQSDVYSFGVVMLELLTGRLPFDSTRPRSEQSLVRWATPQLHDIDALESMVDTALKGTYPAKSLSRFADIIALCVQPEMEFRPPMSEVVQSLVRLMQRASLNKRRSNDDQRGHSSD